MSFSRTLYDKKCTIEKTDRSTAPGFYMLYDGPGENDNQCKAEINPRNARSESRQGPDIPTRVDIDSLLHNRHVPLNNCNANHNEWKDMKKKLDKDPVCDNFNSGPDEYSRYSHPISEYREMTTLPNHITPYLHVNKQIGYSDNYPTRSCQSRQVARDKYSKKN
jgi:hypothetical protein